MIKGGIGGANTLTGIAFEKKTDILTLLQSKKGYQIKDNEIHYEGNLVAYSFKKNAFYKFLEGEGVDYTTLISKKLLPDEALYVVVDNTLYVIEVKFQQVDGSVDEKLQTCDFKRKQYTKLMSQLNIEVEYVYVLSEWFKDPKYKDVLDYIISVGCHYYFDYLPLQKIGLPVPKD